MTDLERLTAERDAWRDLALARQRLLVAALRHGGSPEAARLQEAAALDALVELGIDWRTGERRTG